jgi:aspartyl-tRNA(Asn)/glutamyl-tRNA(Gln) amidotransferase subunit A
MLTLKEASDQIHTRKISPVELTRTCLARIESLDPVLNTFITVTADHALADARQAEAEISAGNYRGPLHGIPVGLKDLFDTAGVRTTAASNQYRNRFPADDAEVVRQLKRAGTVILGKLNMHEFAFGMSGVVSAFGPAKNPWNIEHITGGSSSGSAAAVAAGLCVVALGSDTAGSGRCPPALCGVVGHRPSANLIDTNGVIPLSTSFDTVSPITATVRDAAMLMDVLVKKSDPAFGFVSLLEEDVMPLRVGVARKKFFDDLQPDVLSCVEAALETMAGRVSEVREVEVPVDGFRTIFDAEIYEYHEAMATTHPELYDPRTLFRLQKCAGTSATDYIRARREIEGHRRITEQIFQLVDVVVTPTTPSAAPRLADVEALPIVEARPFEFKYLLRNTLPFSALFWPSISVPCGITREGLPVGMQISSRPGADSTCFRLAHAYQEATQWHKQRSLLD